MKLKKNMLTLIALTISMSACLETEAVQKIAKVDQQIDSKIPSNKGELGGDTKNQYSKPGAPVQLSYTSTKVQAGEESQIDLIFSTQTFDEMNKEGAISINVTVDNGLTISNLSSVFDIQLEPNTTDYPISFSASADSSGLYYVNIFASMLVGANNMNRAFAIPVQVGSDIVLKNRQSTPIEYDENNQPVISMPAIETTH
ncbi:MAG: hypothetical protein V3U84_05565 [Thiotrichaceae bacterium]